jgi:N-acetylated-alpha-linked acidic dipeptidase
MRRLGTWLAPLLVVLLAPLVLGQAPAADAIRGFAPERVAAQRALEEKLQRVPDATSAQRHLRLLTAEPHMAGTEGSRRVADYILARLREYGFQAELARYRVWLPLPVEVSLQLVEPAEMELARAETPFEWDTTSYDAGAVMAFNGYSPSGDVTAPVVYANYGLPEDYAELERLGVDVGGKIVLVRYGRSFRGVKSKVAEERGAAGVIIYSDPADDGYAMGDPYPRGPWRPMSGIQRGSVLYIFQYPGDPLTPGVASTDDARRIPAEEVTNITTLPTMPIAPRDAEEILRRMGGPQVPRAWQGGLPLTYHTGPGQAVVRMRLVMDYRQRDIWNVIGRMEGERPDEWVVLGNHHDAWVFGAVDPSSGTTALLEAARALGSLAREGWRPRRSVVFGFWDAEEYGLLGSTEWVEEHRTKLQQKALAYLNVDSAVSGPNFRASGTPSLHEFLREAARAVLDPRTGRSVYEVWHQWQQRDDSRPANERNGPARLGVLGSGSDYTAFYHHSGVPSLDMGFGGDYGVYHSIYDSYYWMKTFGDPSFAYHATAGRLAGVLALRLAETDVVPLDYEAYAAAIGRYLTDVEGVAREAGGALDLKPVADAVAQMKAAAARANRALASAKIAAMPPERLRELNRMLTSVEQALLNPEGLAGRPWFRHTVFAPGTYTGYAAVMLPGVREAVDRRDWATAQTEAAALAAALSRAATRLDEATRRVAP